MLQQFKSMNELVEYLGKLEERVDALETENRELRAIVPAQKSVNADIIARAVSTTLPQTDILSRSFWRRAFAVYGHMLMANLAVSAVIFLIYLCFMAVMFGSALGSLPRLQ